MKIWHISDSHSSHPLLEIPKDIDLIIFSGDESNYYDVYKNEPEFRDFIEWFGNLPIKHKVFVGGNHSAFVALRTKEVKEICKQKEVPILL